MVQCMNLLKETFNECWPLIARRYEAFKYKQVAAQEYSNFLGKLQDKAKEADLDEMSPADNLTFLCIVGCYDTELQGELLKIPAAKLTIEEITRVSNIYETNVRIQSTLSGNSKSTVDVRKTEAAGGARPKRPFSGKCNICTRVGHLAKECRVAKDKLKCETCGGRQPVPHNTGAYICPKSRLQRLNRGNKTRVRRRRF